MDRYAKSPVVHNVKRKGITRKPIAPPIPEEVIRIKLRLIKIAMEMGDRESALKYCSDAFIETQPEVDIANLSLAELGISTRTRNALEARGVMTLSCILRVGYDFILNIPNLGPKAVAEAKSALEKYGY